MHHIHLASRSDADIHEHLTRNVVHLRDLSLKISNSIEILALHLASRHSFYAFKQVIHLGKLPEVAFLLLKQVVRSHIHKIHSPHKPEYLATQILNLFSQSLLRLRIPTLHRKGAFGDHRAFDLIVQAHQCGQYAICFPVILKLVIAKYDRQIPGGHRWNRRRQRSRQQTDNFTGGQSAAGSFESLS